MSECVVKLTRKNGCPYGKKQFHLDDLGVSDFKKTPLEVDVSDITGDTQLVPMLVSLQGLQEWLDGKADGNLFLTSSKPEIRVWSGISTTSKQDFGEVFSGDSFCVQCLNCWIVLAWCSGFIHHSKMILCIRYGSKALTHKSPILVFPFVHLSPLYTWIRLFVAWVILSPLLRGRPQFVGEVCLGLGQICLVFHYLWMFVAYWPMLHSGI